MIICVTICYRFRGSAVLNQDRVYRTTLPQTVLVGKIMESEIPEKANKRRFIKSVSKYDTARKRNAPCPQTLLSVYAKVLDSKPGNEKRNRRGLIISPLRSNRRR